VLDQDQRCTGWNNNHETYTVQNSTLNHSHTRFAREYYACPSTGQHGDQLLHPLTHETRRPPRASSPSPSRLVIDRTRPRYLSPCTLLEQRPPAIPRVYPRAPSMHRRVAAAFILPSATYSSPLFLSPYPCVSFPAAGSLNSDGTWLPRT
jgi:hypothetical protein